jgi:hypothetical protein
MGKTSVEYQREYRAANKEKINERARAEGSKSREEACQRQSVAAS